MKRQKRGFQLVVFVLAACVLVAAESAGAAGVFAHSSKVATQGPGDGGEGYYVWPETAIQNAELECSNQRLFLRSDRRMSREMISLLLMAYSLDAPVVFIVNGSSCVNGNYEILSVRMNNPR